MNRLLALALLLPLGAAAQSSCRLASAASLAFGNYDVLATSPTDTLTNILVECSRDGGPKAITLTIALDSGANGASAGTRRLLHQGGSGDTLFYGLFRDASRSALWGSTPGVDTASRSLNVPNKGSASTTFTIYGRIPAQQNVSAGNYGDSVQMTLTP